MALTTSSEEQEVRDERGPQKEAAYILELPMVFVSLPDGTLGR